VTDDEVAEAIVLRMVAFGEADRMASLLMADGSRREVRVAQARRSRKRFGGLDVYVRVECRFVPDPKGRVRLETTTVLDGHAGLRGDVVRSALAAHVAELALQASQEGHPLPDLHRLVQAGIVAIARGQADARPMGWARAFELKLLHVLGIRPALTRDAITGGELGERLRWSTTHGGVLAEGGPTDARSLPVARATLTLMNEALRTPLADQAAVPWTEEAGAQAEAALQDFLAVHVGRRSRARTFLSQMVTGLSAVAVLGIAVLGAGCVGYEPPSSVRVQGYVFETTEPVDGAVVVGGTRSRAIALDGTEVEGEEPFSDTPGWVRFAGLAPEAQHHLVFLPPAGEADHPEATEHIATVVSGNSAADDLFVDAGSFHLFPRATVEAWLVGWELVEPSLPLPDFDPDSEGGGFVRGRVLDAGRVIGERLTLVDAEGVQRPARYADAGGAPSAAEPGLSASGVFFVFGAAAGPAILRTVEADDSLGPEGLALWIEEDACTSLPRVALTP
jgi:DNA repair protein RecO (recombination protein O)